MRKTCLNQMLLVIYPMSKIWTFLLITTYVPTIAVAADTLNENVTFNTSVLDSEFTKNIDIKQFSLGSGIQPGQYLVDIWVNDNFITTQKVNFIKVSDSKVSMCISSNLLAQFNVSSAALTNIDKLNNGKCAILEEVISSAKLDWDSSQQKLVINIPQKDLLKTARGSVPPSLWQDGSSAAFIGYNANLYQSNVQGKTFSSQYLNLNSGLNLIGGWYFRHKGALTKDSTAGERYQNLNTYLQHDLTPIKGRILIGQSNTSGRLFDAVGYTGISVFSDDQMLPESQRGYAPEIRGIAGSHSRVTIRQGGNIIYETTVPAGAFVINDLYPTGYGGDLKVTVREANGGESSYVVPYASVSDLLRPGASRYEAVIGKYRQNNGNDGQPFYQFTWQQGISNFLTLYGGAQFSDGYQAYQVGNAFSTPLGALAFDVTQTNTRTVRDQMSGQSYRFTYNKLISETQSNIALAAYRFSTRNYLDFEQAMEYQNLQKGDIPYPNHLYRTKNRYSLTVSQGLANNWGTLFLSGISQNYWNRLGNDVEYQVGYNNRWKRLSYSLTATRNRASEGSMDTSWLISFSFPFGEDRPINFSSSLSRDGTGSLTQQASLAGTMGDNQQVNWGISATHSDQIGNTGSFNGQYMSPWTALNITAGLGEDSHTLSAGLTGAIVMHQHGVTLTPYSSDTWIVVNAPGASGAEVTSYPGLKIDYWGNAAIPAFMPYQRNLVGIDPKELSNKIEMQSTNQNIVPRAGAVVIAKFETHQGYGLLLIPESDEFALPFGTQVADAYGNQVGMIGQAGMVYARVENKNGNLLIKRSEGGECIVPYSVIDENKPMQEISYSCSFSEDKSR